MVAIWRGEKAKAEKAAGKAAGRKEDGSYMTEHQTVVRSAGVGTTPERDAGSIAGDCTSASYAIGAHPMHACDGSGKAKDTTGGAAEGGARAA